MVVTTSILTVQLGKQVGYSTVFEDMTEPGTTFLKYMTDGALLREVMEDQTLDCYSTVILDGAHERTLESDILMALLKSLAQRRSDLKIVIMSDMRNAKMFQKYFKIDRSSTVPLLDVSGHQYPVEVFYTQKPEPDYVCAAIRTALMIHREEGPGDILIFLAREEEVEEVCQKLQHDVDNLIDCHPHTVGPLTCIPLYASLSPEQQQRAFNRNSLPPANMGHTLGGLPGRWVVVSTDCSKSTLKIDGIGYVVDSGFSIQKVYNPRIRVMSQLASPISKVSSQWRARCAGRTQPGKCFRLYTEKDFMSELEEKTHPEILTSNLAYIVLVLVRLGVKVGDIICVMRGPSDMAFQDIVRFNWVDVPAPESLMRALELLNYLAAIDDDGNITALGSTMAEFPLEPQVCGYSYVHWQTCIYIVSRFQKCSSVALNSSVVTRS